MRGHSILRRILLLHAVATLVTAALVAGGAMMLVDSTGDRLHRQILDEYADKMLTGVSRNPAGGLTLSPQAGSWLRGGGSSLSFWIVDRGRRVRVEGLRFGPALNVPTRSEPAYFTRLRGSKIYSGVTAPLPGQTATWVVIVQDLDHPDVIFDDLRTQIAVVGGGLLALFIVGLLAADAWIVRRSLAPIDRASREVERVSPHQLHQRVDTEGMPGEVLPLLRAFNVALDRVEDAYRIERDFAADAAHELRTPLAILRLRVGQQPEGGDPQLLRQIDALEAIVERLLLVAEVDAMVCDPSEVVDLRAVAEERVAAIAPLLIAGGKHVEITGLPAVQARASSHFAERALDVLLENAMKHTPPGTSVTVEVGPGATLSVADTGPGLADYRAERFERFGLARRDLARSGGLGLAIAQELMGKVGGSIEAVPNTPQGALFRLGFVAAEA